MSYHFSWGSAGAGRYKDLVDAAPPADPAPMVVEVRGDARTPTGQTLSRAQARELPGAFGDPLRAVDSLPGVVPTISGLPVFFIRGAPPASIGYVVDGVELPLLYHAFLGPSVLHPGLLSGVVLQSAPADVRYGGSAGALLVAEASTPSPKFRGEANLRLFDAGALVEAPFSEGDGSALVAGRYSFTGLLYSALSDQEFGYWDYQARLSRRVGARTTLGLFAFGAADHYAGDELTGGDQLSDAVGGDTGFHRVDLRLSHASERLTITSALTLGQDRTSDSSASLTDRSLRVRTDASFVLERSLALRLGGSARVNDIELEADSNRLDRGDLLELFPTRTDHTFGGYVGVSWQPERRLNIEPGVRADLYASQGEHAAAADPRLVVSARLASGLTVEHRFGLASQVPNFVPGVPAAQVGSLSRGLVRGWHASSSARLALPLELTASIAGFQSHYDNVVDPLGQSREFRLDKSAVERRQDLTSRGIELRVGRPLTRRVGGYIAYTLSYARRHSGREQSWSGYDRRHVLQGALALELWWKLRASARGLYYSGFPALEIGDAGALPSSQLRAPGFFRLDGRLERPFRISAGFELAVVAEVLNANAAKETLRYECGGRCELISAGPITLPSIGLEATF